MGKIKEQVKGLFKSNPSYKKLYAFEDGNIFSDESFALNHQRSTKANMETFNREDFAPTETKTVQDQLKAIDLDKVEKSDYNALKSLRDALSLKTDNNKFETILESLKKAKAELLNQPE